jgi:hypothetical protein
MAGASTGRTGRGALQDFVKKEGIVRALFGSNKEGSAQGKCHAEPAGWMHATRFTAAALF